MGNSIGHKRVKSIFLCFSDLLTDVAVFEHPNIVGHVQLTLDDDNGQMLLGAR